MIAYQQTWLILTLLFLQRNRTSSSIEDTRILRSQFGNGIQNHFACPDTQATIGYPKTIRVDQGSEFVSRDLDLWAYQKGVTLDFSRPGKPTDNAFIEAFNGGLS